MKGGAEDFRYRSLEPAAQSRRPLVTRFFSRRRFLRYAAATGASALTATTGAPTASATVFNASDFGVVADGAPHNNVANLLDCFAEAAVVGASVLLPAGVIDTSDAVTNTVLTAASGRTYTNNGGIPLPKDTPMTISGERSGATVIRLSAGFPRAFDFWWIANGQRYQGITIRRMTIDRNNLTGQAIAPASAASTTVALARGGTWTTLPGISATTFRNARFVWFPESNTGTANSLGMASRVSGAEFQVRNDSASTDYTLNGGDLVQGSLRDHVIVGTVQFGGSVPSGWDMSIDGLTVEDVESVNVATQTAASLKAAKSDSSPNIMIDVQKNSSAAVPTVTNCVIRNVRMNGGESGAYIGGQNGCFIDECWFVDCFHDTMVDPVTNYVSANFMFGQNAWVGRVGLTRCHGRRSGDVACEIDQPWEAHEVDCTWDDAYNGVYSTTFVPPARTPSGPPTTTLAAAISATWDQSEAVVPVDGLPIGVSRTGLFQIDSELFWYSAENEAGTNLALRRGVNGTTSAAHSPEAVVTFVETHRTRIHSVGSTIRNNVVMSAPGAGRGFTQYQQDNLPLPPLSIRNASVDIVGGRLLAGQGIYWIGWQPDLDVQELRFTQVDLSDALPGSGSVVSWSWEYGTVQGAAAPFPRPRVYGRTNRAYVRGNIREADAVFSSLDPGDECTAVDFDFTSVVKLGRGASQSRGDTVG